MARCPFPTYMADEPRETRSLRDRAGNEAEDLSHLREPRLKRWFLFEGDRKHVTAFLLGGVFVALVLLGVVWPIEYRRLVAETTTIQTVFNTLLSGVILLVSIVVAVASVGISQELTSLGEQHERIETAAEFRSEIGAHEEIQRIPARPGQVIVASLKTIHQRATDLDALADEHADSDLQEDVSALKAGIEANIEDLLSTMESVQPGTTDELLVGLDYDASWQFHQTYRIKQAYADQLAEDERAVLDDLATALDELMTSREYFKTLYYKREFSDLSTVLLVVSLPVLLFITYVLLALDAGLFPEFTFGGLSPLAVFISLAYTIALAPYVILTAYVLRAASVTKRTPAVGPFVVGTDHELPFDDDALEADLEQ